ncbi:4Fe-4S binding protein [Methanotorris igneus]|uniref:4Fe-4S ferredoxin iron-sulfur binding domain-containing protein n=1 Tax=Methanotorris igneus (strain DSM 5666 / JCM 11834 / Kol 5) TaxID=880724 RepID=F6BBL5_METIK|nr:4Fe-4S binding protein [Methanotorris igneus]AEF96024.1 4Fe-4S ferredoxin iron-sulfur binding domain-containing protein [Methanotorris igneus Kol 5]
MPEHILSGIKALVAMKMRKEGKLQKEIAEYLNMDRSIVSHYLHGRYPSDRVMKVSEVIVELPVEYGARIIHSLSNDKYIAKKLIKVIYNAKIKIEKDKCLACGACLGCEAISIEGIEVKINENRCVLCGECISKCPMNALKFVEE